MDEPFTVIKDAISMLLFMLVETSIRLIVIPVWFGLIDTNKLETTPLENIAQELNWSWTDIVGQFERHEKIMNSNKYAWITNHSKLWNVIMLGIECFIILFHAGLFMSLLKTFVSIFLLHEHEELFGGCGIVIGIIFHVLTRYVDVTKIRFVILISPLINFTAVVCIAYLRNYFPASTSTSPSPTSSVNSSISTTTTNTNNATSEAIITQSLEKTATKDFQHLVTSYGSETTIRLHATIPSNQMRTRYQLLCFLLRLQYVEIWIRSKTTMLTSRVTNVYKRFHPHEYEDCRDKNRTTMELSRNGFHNDDSYNWVLSKVPNIVELFEEAKDDNLLPAIHALNFAIQRYQASRPSWHVMKKNAHKHFLNVIDSHIARILAIPFEEVEETLKQYLVKPNS